MSNSPYVQFKYEGKWFFLTKSEGLSANHGGPGDEIDVDAAIVESNKYHDLLTGRDKKGKGCWGRWCARLLIRNRKLQVELKETLPFVKAVKARHNGYNPEFCKELNIEPPVTPEIALQDLQDTWDSMENRYAERQVDLEAELGRKDEIIFAYDATRSPIMDKTIINLRADLDKLKKEKQEALSKGGFVAWQKQICINDAKIKTELGQRVEDLEAELDAVKDGLKQLVLATRWIPVADGPPEESGFYFVGIKRPTGKDFAKLYYDKIFARWHMIGNRSQDDILFYMSIPTLPEGGE